MNTEMAAWGPVEELASLKHFHRKRLAQEAIIVPSSPVPARQVARTLMEVKATELVRALSGPDGFEIPEKLEEGMHRRIRGARLHELGSGAEYNVYIHRASQTVYKIPHQDNWKFWGSAEEKQAAMREALRTQRLRYAQVDKALLKTLSAEYAPTYFIAAPDTKGNPVFVIAQPYLPPNEYVQHRLSSEERAIFEKARVDDLTAANVLYHVPSGRLVLMDCIFATELIEDESSS